MLVTAVEVVCWVIGSTIDNVTNFMGSTGSDLIIIFLMQNPK